MCLHPHHDASMWFPPKHALRLYSWPFEAYFWKHCPFWLGESKACLGVNGSHWAVASEISDDERIITHYRRCGCGGASQMKGILWQGRGSC